MNEGCPAGCGLLRYMIHKHPKFYKGLVFEGVATFSQANSLVSALYLPFVQRKLFLQFKGRFLHD